MARAFSGAGGCVPGGGGQLQPDYEQPKANKEERTTGFAEARQAMLPERTKARPQGRAVLTLTSIAQSVA